MEAKTEVNGRGNTECFGDILTWLLMFIENVFCRGEVGGESGEDDRRKVEEDEIVPGKLNSELHGGGGRLGQGGKFFFVFFLGSSAMM